MSLYVPLLPYRITYISRPKLNGIGRHAGVLLEWLGGSFVVDRQLDQGLRVVSRDEFATGLPFSLATAVEGHSAVREAMHRLDAEYRTAPGYDLFKRNCEHFAQHVVHGVARSPQIAMLVVVGAVALALVMLNDRT